MDSSLLLLPLARQRLIQALALGFAAPGLTDPILPMLACNPLLSFAATAVEAPAAPAEVDTVTGSHEWSPKEDELLKALIAEHGTSKWSRIAAKMSTKTNRQCRRRWQAIMNSMGNKGSWTAEEDAKLMEGHRRFGNRWTDIARLVPGRTDNAVKNRFAALVAKGEGVKSLKVKRWSDMCVAPKDGGADPEDGEESCPSPCSPGSSGSCASSAPKRKADAVDAPAKRMKEDFFSLDLNVAPEGADTVGWLASESEWSSSSCTQSASESGEEEVCDFDLNSPACA